MLTIKRSSQECDCQECVAGDEDDEDPVKSVYCSKHIQLLISSKIIITLHINEWKQENFLSIDGYRSTSQNIDVGQKYSKKDIQSDQESVLLIIRLQR